MSVEEYAAQVKAELQEAWLPAIYSERIRKMRTRSYKFPPITSKTRIDIQHTLLGVELKVGRRRMLCPDLATARYLSVFARAGCLEVAVPYDITKISQLADQLDSSWYRTLLMVDRIAAGKPEAFKARVRNRLVRQMREELEAAGAGSSVPEFKQSTKQRR
jgi:hypothetical protein